MKPAPHADLEGVGGDAVEGDPLPNPKTDILQGYLAHKKLRPP